MQDTQTNSSVEGLVGQIKSLGGLFAKDVASMTSEMLSNSPGGVARTGYDLIYEVTTVNRLVADHASGKRPVFKAPDGWMMAPASFMNKDHALIEFSRSVDDVAASLSSCTEERLSEVVDTPMGKSTLLDFAQILPVHIMYHSGQLNYIQTIHGDAVLHWAS